MSDCIRTEKLNDRLWCLKEVESVNRYLILGDEKALLFDTGYGYLDFRDQIKDITDLPLVVVNSHGDPDHALGSYLFPDVWIHSADYPYLRDLDLDAETKRGTVLYRFKKLPQLADEMDVEEYIKPHLDGTAFHFMEDGDRFDLGGLTLMVYSTPGHSKGSVCLYCPEKSWLFTGDSVAYYNVFYHTGLGHHAPFRAYVSSLKRLQALDDGKLELYPAHGQKPIPASAIEETIDCVRDLLVNHASDESIQTMVGAAYPHTCGHALILYAEDVLKEALENGIE